MTACVYAFFDEEHNPLYVGSTSDLQRRLFKEHFNAKYKKHGKFGRWLHDGNIDNVYYKTLERVEAEPEKMREKLRQREFHYKRSLPPQKFGQLDGVGLQSVDLQLKIRREKLKEKNKNNANFKPRGPQKIPVTQKQKEVLARRRELYKKRVEASGRKYKPRKLNHNYTPSKVKISKSKAEYLKWKRAVHKQKVEAEGRVYRPRSTRLQRAIIEDVNPKTNNS